MKKEIAKTASEYVDISNGGSDTRGVRAIEKEWEAKQEVDLFDDLVAEDGKELPFEKQELLFGRHVI